MKNLLILMSTVLSISSFAFDPKELAKDYSESQVVTELVKEIESNYGITCSGKPTSLLPSISKQITYKADCGMDARILKLIITSNFKYKNRRNEFTLKSYKVKFFKL